MDEGPSNSNSTSINTVDLDGWVRSSERKRSYYVSLIQTGRPITNCRIDRVPQMMFGLERSAYEPVSLSIGPYHHGNPAHRALEKVKWNYLNYILKLNPEKTLQDYIHFIQGLEQQARSCYPKELVMQSDEFIKMLLLDGCFLLVALYGIRGRELPATRATELSFTSTNNLGVFEGTSRHVTVEQLTDSISEDSNTVKQGSDLPSPMSKWMTAFLVHDLFLLENQIPFFVVRGIYELFAGQWDSSKLDDRIGAFLEDIIGYTIPLRETCRPNRFHHLLHFWHLYLSPSEDSEEQPEHHRRFILFPSYFGRIYQRLNIRHTSNKGKIRKNIQSSQFLRQGHHLIRWRRAEQYHEAGIHFQKRVFSENDRHSLLDVRFSDGLIEIPSLIIAWHTASFFKNILALEQTCPQYGNYFTSYCAFLSQFVTKPADVTLLAKRGILVHHMRTDEEVSAVLSQLGKNVDFDVSGSHYLKSICRRMEEHYQSRINRWMAWLWHNHFSNPWLSLAVLAATIVLLCTILQTLFTFLAYFNPAEA
jgi:hypothetical protein